MGYFDLKSHNMMLFKVSKYVSEYMSGSGPKSLLLLTPLHAVSTVNFFS